MRIKKKASWQRVFYGRLNKGVRRRIGTRRYVGFMHAHKDGAPVLLGESSWRTICGIYVNHRWGFFTVQPIRRGKP